MDEIEEIHSTLRRRPPSVCEIEEVPDEPVIAPPVDAWLEMVNSMEVVEQHPNYYYVEDSRAANCSLAVFACIGYSAVLVITAVVTCVR